MRTPLCDLLGIEQPIVLAPMGGAVGPRLAAAVSNAGGLGMLPLTWSDDPAGVIRELASLVRDFPGEAPVYVDLVTSMGSKLLELGPNYRVKPVPDFFAEVKALLGEAAVL